MFQRMPAEFVVRDVGAKSGGRKRRQKVGPMDWNPARVEIFCVVNDTIWKFPVSCSQVTLFKGCPLLLPNWKSSGICTIRTTPTLRGVDQSPRTETHIPSPLLPLDLHYSMRNVHPPAPGLHVRRSHVGNAVLARSRTESVMSTRSAIFLKASGSVLMNPRLPTITPTARTGRNTAVRQRMLASINPSAANRSVPTLSVPMK